MKSPALVPHSWHQRLPLFLGSRAPRAHAPAVGKGDFPAKDIGSIAHNGGIGDVPLPSDLALISKEYC